MRHHLRLFVAFTLCMTLLPNSAGSLAYAATDSMAPKQEGVTGLPLPRFASLRTNEVNMRTGPGTRYPIEWVLKRKNLPVQIVAEYEIWRRIREPDGAEGWVHKTSLTGKRYAQVIAHGYNLHESNDDEAVINARLEKGAIGEIVTCTLSSCHLDFDGTRGWITKEALWGVLPDETLK